MPSVSSNSNDYLPNAPRGPQLAAGWGERNPIADLAPRPADERIPKNVVTGQLPDSAVLVARENFTEKIIPLILAANRATLATREAAVRSLYAARATALETFDYLHGLSTEKTPAEVKAEADAAVRAKELAAAHARYAKEREARDRLELLDRNSRDEWRNWRATNLLSTPFNSAGWHKERTEFQTKLNAKRIAAGLNPIPYN